MCMYMCVCLIVCSGGGGGGGVRGTIGSYLTVVRLTFTHTANLVTVWTVVIPEMAVVT